MAPLLSHLVTEMVAAPFTSLTASLITLTIFFLTLWWSTRCFKRVRNRQLPPRPSGSWPLIGHLNLFTGPEVAHKTLAKVADEYGPIFQIKLGVHTAVVVSSWEMAKECLSTNDRAFASRPRTRAFDLLGYNCAMIGLAPYGPYWREVRKIATLELLSNHRIAKLNHIGINEVRTSMKDLYRRWWAEAKQNPAGGRDTDSGVIVDMQKWFSDVTVNSILRLVAGVSLRDIPEQDRCHKALRAFFDLTGIFTPSDALPYLRWLDLGGYEKTMKMAAKELDFFTQGWLESHKRERESNKEKRDFMDLLLDVFDSAGDYEKKFFEHDTDTVIKATSQAMVLAASDTTTVTLTWALSLLLNNHEVLRKAQDEIDSHVGSGRPLDESDTKQLVYLQAIIKETLRLYPAAPLVPRESIEDVTINGYHIPIGTRLFVNLHKMHRDSRVWGDHPHDFIPERFLTCHKEVDVRGQNFEMTPFGSGRRICPGLSYALQTLSFTLANVLHGFEISCPSDKRIDMTEGTGLTSFKVDPLCVMLVPRLNKDHYENIA